MLGFGIFVLPLALLYLILPLYVVVVTVAVEHADVGQAAAETVALLALLHFGHVLNVWALLTSPLHVLTVIAIYLAVGGPWTIVKWRFYMSAWKREALDRIAAAKVTFLAGRETSTSAENASAWERKVERDLSEYMTPPLVKHHKRRLLSWGVFWPFSAVWTVINDPVRRFYEWLLFGVLGNYLQSIADKRHAAVKKALQGI